MARIDRYAKGLALVAANMPQAALIVDKKLHVQYSNHAAPKFFGYKVSELHGSSLHMLIDPNYWLNIKENITCLLADDSCAELNSRIMPVVIQKKNGEKLTVQVTAVILLTDNDNEVYLRFDSVPPPVPQKSAIETQLQAASVGSELVHALDMLEDSVIILDDKWRYQFVNKTAWEVLDLDKEEVLGHNIWTLRPHLKGSQWEKMARLALKTQKTQRAEEFYPALQRWYVTNFYPSPHTLICRMEDVTALKETQRINDQLLGTFKEAMEIYWSDENRTRRSKPVRSPRKAQHGKQQSKIS